MKLTAHSFICPRIPVNSSSGALHNQRKKSGGPWGRIPQRFPRERAWSLRVTGQRKGTSNKEGALPHISVGVGQDADFRGLWGTHLFPPVASALWRVRKSWLHLNTVFYSTRKRAPPSLQKFKTSVIGAVRTWDQKGLVTSEKNQLIQSWPISVRNTTFYSPSLHENIRHLHLHKLLNLLLTRGFF